MYDTVYDYALDKHHLSDLVSLGHYDANGVYQSDKDLFRREKEP